MSSELLELSALAPVPFRNAAARCIGTGRLALALHREYAEQLRAVQSLCHFEYIRGHGLFCDDLGIYQRVRTGDTEETRYNFTYLDRVMDLYREVGLRPFLELGFMPAQLARGEQTLFYYKANTTPPRDYDEWDRLIYATLTHLADRYGADEVRQWPVEVWNEPNLPGFWEKADRDEYLKLYRVSSLAASRAVPGIRIGGPAVCGGSGCLEWIECFLHFVRDNQLPLDFLTRHIYMAQTPERRGRYTYHTMCAPEDSLQELHDTRRVMEKVPPYGALPIYVTEFNTSYHPFCPIHDTVQNAALTAGMLSLLGDEAELYSYWTFGDVFEEQGIPPAPFHGGFGLMANGLIPKPTLWAFSFFSRLSGECIARDQHMVCMRSGNRYEGILWQACPAEPSRLEKTLVLASDSPCTVILESVRQDAGNPLKIWQDMGQPASLSTDQLQLLRQAASPEVSSCILAPRDGRVTLCLTLEDNAVVHFRIEPSVLRPDDGYDAAWYR